MADGLQLPVGQVPHDWKVLPLKDVTSKIGSGSTPRGGASVYVEAGTSFIRSQNVLDHGFSFDGLVRINDEAAYSLRGVEVLEGDVLINITGDSILRTCIVPIEVLPARVSQHVAILRSNGQIEPQVLQKWLSLELMKDFMLGHSSGGTRKAVTKGDLERFPVPVPPLAEQRAISGVLGALDDKIESNRRLVEISLDLVSTKFAHEESLSAKRTPLSRLLTLERGREPGRDLCREDGLGTPFIRVSNLKMETHRGLTLENFDGPLAKPEDILISFDGTPGRVAFGLTGYFSSGVRRALPAGRLMPTSLIWAMLSGESVQAVISEYATGTTIQHAGSALPHLTAPLLSESGFSWFENEGENLWRYILGLRRSSETLFSLQTSLSLELLSGRLRVKDAESMLENV